MFISKFDKIYRQIIAESNLIYEGAPWTDTARSIFYTWGRKNKPKFKDLYAKIDADLSQLAEKYPDDQDLKKLIEKFKSDPKKSDGRLDASYWEKNLRFVNKNLQKELYAYGKDWHKQYIECIKNGKSKQSNNKNNNNDQANNKKNNDTNNQVNNKKKSNDNGIEGMGATGIVL